MKGFFSQVFHNEKVPVIVSKEYDRAPGHHQTTNEEMAGSVIKDMQAMGVPKERMEEFARDMMECNYEEERNAIARERYGVEFIPKHR